MSCDVGEVLIIQPFRHFTYVTTHSPNLPLLHLRHSSFSNPSVVSHTSQFILQPFFRFSYVTSPSLNSPGEPPMKYYVNFSKLATFSCIYLCLQTYALTFKLLLIWLILAQYRDLHTGIHKALLYYTSQLMR